MLNKILLISQLVLVPLASAEEEWTAERKANAQDSSDVVTKIETTDVLTFNPFALEDLGTNPKTGKPWQPDDLMKFELSPTLTVEYLAKDAITKINDIERDYNEVGKSLRSGNLNNVYSILTDPDVGFKARAKDLGMELQVLKDKVQDAIENCRLFTIADLQKNIETGLPFDEDSKIKIEDGVTVTAKQLVDKLNKQQEMLCSIGYSLINEFGDLLPEMNGVGGLISRVIFLKIFLLKSIV